jgi:hypothetical protein
LIVWQIHAAGAATIAPDRFDMNVSHSGALVGNTLHAGHYVKIAFLYPIWKIHNDFHAASSVMQGMRECQVALPQPIK